MNRNSVAQVLAEFLGTAVLVMIALILGQTTAVSYFIATSMAAAAAVVYLLFNMVSGAHTNPAVTFGMWTARQIGTLKGIAYIAAQLLGGIASWQLFQYLTDHTLTAKSTSFSTPVFVAELIGTLVVAMAFAAALNKKVDSTYSGLMVGAAYFVGIIIAATASAGYINPAIAIGSRAWSAAYVLGPLVGGLIGVNLYHFFFNGENSYAGAFTSKKSTSSKGVVVKRTTVRKKKTTKK
ncbi:aquaporin [Candidatus Saccharibacteria bacterium]|nr:aquaporin [Candidatus Saccharibacteria bacterium]